MNKLDQTLQGIPKGEALSFIVGAPGTIVSSSLEDLHTIHIHDNKATHDVPFLRATTKLHMHSLS